VVVSFYHPTLQLGQFSIVILSMWAFAHLVLVPSSVRRFREAPACVANRVVTPFYMLRLE
jgi:hypothetical protein